MSNRKLSVIALAICLLIGIDLALFWRPLSQEKILTFKRTGLFYPTKEHNSVLFSGPNQNPSYVEIAFRFQAPTVHNNGPLFRTAIKDFGLRAEITQNGEVEVRSREDSRDQTHRFPISTAVSDGNWHSFNLVFSIERGVPKLQVSLDGVKRIDVTNLPLNPFFTEFELGGAYDAQSKFEGNIQNFEMSCGEMRVSKARLAILCMIYLVLALVSLLSCATLFRLRQTKPKIELKDLWPPIAASIIPALFLASVNVGQIALMHLLMSSLLLSVGGLALFVFLTLFATPQRASLIATTLISIFFSYQGLEPILRSRFQTDELTLATFALLWILGALTAALIPLLRTLAFTRVFLFSFLVITTGNLLFAELRSYKGTRSAPTTTPEVKIKANNVKHHPDWDVYYLVLDMYGNSRNLKKFFNFDNSKFLNELRKRGFTVAEESTSNYRQTILSVPSALNMDYIKVTRISDLQELYLNSAVARYFKNNGYKHIWINPHKVLSDTNPYADRSHSCDQRSNLNSAVFTLTPLQEFNIDSNLHRTRVNCGFRLLKDSIHDPEKKFVFTHVLCPHHPYVFGPEGENVGERHDIEHLGTNGVESEINRGAYIDQLRYVNHMTLESIDEILWKSPRPAIIVLLSDHGPALYDNSLINNGRIMPGNDYMHARMGNLTAIYMPEGLGKTLDPKITPINVFRFVLNNAFRESFPYLQNRNIYSSDGAPFNMKDITNIISSTQ